MSLQADFEVRENVLVVRLSGELDHHEAEKLRDQWRDMIYENPVKHVLLNLEAVSFMDSSGLGVVLGRYKEVLQLGGEMVVCSVTPPVQRLFEMSGLYKIVRHAECEDTALSVLGVAS
ncbi:anti-sigma F factor antagonist [Aciduricibacillus chroicocephali]|uniref:Anti-sigma F factor antagonist n=1 Tax=Aciduricibacillus chroicocephali TaxID=3054939 RepID=A0ABY9KS02_9BACI|nr:anti-sigma F factor antagonist [Bacillaceae bacterium 44XB]